MREREDANRTREAGHLDEIQGVVANKLDLFGNGASLLANIFGVGFIDWLDRFAYDIVLGWNKEQNHMKKWADVWKQP